MVHFVQQEIMLFLKQHQAVELYELVLDFYKDEILTLYKFEYTI
jgi:hypothetical protein